MRHLKSLFGLPINTSDDRLALVLGELFFLQERLRGGTIRRSQTSIKAIEELLQIQVTLWRISKYIRRCT